MNLSLKRRSVQNRRLIATSTLCVLAGLLASFRQPAPANAEHNLPPVSIDAEVGSAKSAIA
jgi:hypothetical protein